MRNRVLSITLLCLFAGSEGMGQNERGSLPANTSNVRLQIEAPLGKTVYRLGEVIPLELAFSTSGASQFRVQQNPSFRQSGAIADVVVVEPQSGWDDPLGGFFQSCPLMLSGGLYEDPSVTNGLVKIPLILNERARFKQTGDYHLTVRSHRVTVIGAFPNMPQPSVDATFSFRVDAAPKDWQSQTLDDAMRVVNSIKSDSPDLAEQQKRRRAVNAIRFLGTEEAASAMIRLLTSEPYSYELLAGLVGSPARDMVGTEMRRLLVDPHFPVVGEFLCALAIVARPAGTVNRTPANKTELEARFREELRMALPNKVGQARVVSSVTANNQP